MNTDPGPVNILLIAGDPADVHAIQRLLTGHLLTHTVSALVADPSGDQITAALQRLAEGGFDLVLLDLTLPGSQDLSALARVQQQAPEVPIVVLTGNDEAALGVNAVRAGAQDYLVKGQLTSAVLLRTLRHAIERHRLLAELRSLALRDALTGLYNRRGFQTLVEQQLKLARRMTTGLLLLFVELDALKELNDTFGLPAGDRALVHTATVLRQTFRESDIVARWSSDEFAVLAIGASGENAQTLTARLQVNVARYNADHPRDPPLSVSVGAVHFDPQDIFSLDKLMARVEQALYAKSAKTRGRPAVPDGAEG